MENGNGAKKRIIECIEKGIELDKEGHAELRMSQRRIKFDDVKNALKSFDKIESIKAYMVLQEKQDTIFLYTINEPSL
ncbi:MAG: DUF4258 domain-containing protein [Candidatus Aenigmatarchaeota archaeon]